MWKDYLRLGENEIGNSARAVGYARTADCSVYWLKNVASAGIRDATGDADYDTSQIQLAPWYDPRDPATTRFYGAYVASAVDLSGSTREAGITEGILSGGKLGLARDAARRVRVRLILTATDMEALEAGMAWLKGALNGRSCGQHGEGCGTTDFTFFADAPPAQEITSEDDYAARIARLTRKLHGVGVISGPFPVEEYISGDRRHVGRLVEFTIGAEVPWIFGVTEEIPIAAISTTIVPDVPYNLVPYPSAELGSGSVVVGRNFSANPSVEVNDTGFVAAASALTGAAPSGYLTSGRSNDIAADGSWSFRGRLLGNGSTVVTNATARIQLHQDVSLTPVDPDHRMSFSMWASALILGGASGSAINALQGFVEWRNGGGLMSTEAMGSALPADYDGRVFTLNSRPIPAGATIARLIVRADVTWSSSATPANNSDIRVYMDALAPTVP